VLRTEQINRQDLQDEQDKSKKKILEILLILSKNETFMPLLFRTEQPWVEHEEQLPADRNLERNRDPQTDQDPDHQ
ncbi:MAG: hypothetical protein KKC18_08640, partial [Chloroflexi bacterium]|nr:hypothetical protein [Chloroflexota bacterium]